MELTEAQQRARATWSAGDFDAIADRILRVGIDLVERVGVSAGERVLDVACGSGNATIPAAVAGGEVTGVDITPELFEPGRRRAAEAGVEIEWVEGDAEALPVGDESFDAVVSVFGCMFAPRHRVAAAELARVLRPGGRLCVAAWTPEGEVGELFATLGGYMPAPPPIAEAPVLWGSEDHVRDLFADAGLELEFTRETVQFPRFDTVEEEVEFSATKFGPMIMARRMLPPERWEALVADMSRLIAAQTGAMEYLVTTGRKGYAGGDA